MLRRPLVSALGLFLFSLLLTASASPELPRGHAPEKAHKGPLQNPGGPEQWAGFENLSPEIQTNLRTGPLTPLATPIQGPNVRANDITGDAANETQGEVSVAAWNQYVVVAWFDSKAFDGVDPYTGYAYSCDYGATFTDGIGPASLAPGDIVYRTGSLIADNEGNFYLGLNYGINNWADDTHMVYRGQFSGCSFSWDTPVMATHTAGDPNEYLLYPKMTTSPVDSSLAMVYARGTYVNGFEETRIEVVVSPDRGATWGSPVDISGWGRHHDPVIAAGPGGELYVAYFNDFFGYTTCDLSSPNWYENTWVSKSADGGASWSAPSAVAYKVNNLRLNTGPGDSRGWMYEGPSIAVDQSGGPGSGNVYIAWQEAAAWAAPVETGNFVTEIEPNDAPPDGIVIAPGDSAVGSSDVGQNDYWTISLNAGESIIIRLEPDDYTCGIETTAHDFYMALYSDATVLGYTRMAISNTSYWIQQIAFTSPDTANYYLRVYQQGGGPTGYTVRTGLINMGPDMITPARDEGDIVAIVSTDGGATFSPKVVVNADAPVGYREDYPAVTVDDTGNVRFFWYDRRETEGATLYGAQYTDVYMATSTDFLSTIGPGVRITDESFPNAGAPRSSLGYGQWMGAFSDGGHVMTGWGDQRLSNQATSHFDAYTSLLDFEPPSTAFETAPAESSYVLDANVPFEWAGTDRKSPTSALEYATELDSGGFGVFSQDTTAVLNLSAGWHTFKVRARDEAGNEESTAVSTFAVDLSNPTVSLVAGPGEGLAVAADSVVFGWAGSDDVTPGNQIEYSYQLDGGGYSAWTLGTSATLTGLSVGPHILDVQARDLAGRIGSTTRNFNVDVAVRWNVDASGNWATGSNWNTGTVPTASDSVVIDRPSATVTVTVSSGTRAAASLYSTETLSISGGSLSLGGDSQTAGLTVANSPTFAVTGNLLVTSGLTWYGGTMSGAGTTTLDTGTTNSLADGATNGYLSGRTLVNLGTLTWPADNFYLNNGAVLDNQGLFLVSGAANRSLTSNSGSGSLLNSGTFQKTGNHVLTLASTITVNNTGLFDIDAGSVDLRGTSTQDGDADVAGGATLDFSQNDQTFTAGSNLISAGTVSRTGTGTTTIQGNLDIIALSMTDGNFSIAHDDTIPNVTLNGNNNLSVTGNLLVTSGLTWYGGTMSGAGTTTLDTGTTNSLADGATNGYLSGRTLVNLSTLTWPADDFYLNNNAVLDNQGTISASGPANRSLTSNSGTGTFLNSGTLQKTGNHILTLASTVTVNNTGLFDIDAGSLDLSGPSTVDGNADVAGGATLDFSQNDQTFTAGSSLVSAGTVSRTGTGTTTIQGNLDIVAFSMTSGNFSIAHGDTISSITLDGINDLSVTGDLLVTSGLTWYAGTMSGAGTTTLDAGTSSSFADGFYNNYLSGRTLVNLGTLTWPADNFFIDNGGVLDNQGVFLISGSASRGITTSSGSGSFLNSGTLQHTNSGITTTASPITTTNSGTFDINAGSLQINGAFTNYAANTLTGGTYEVTTTFRIQNANILTNAASIALDGPLALVVDQFSTNALQNMTLNDTGASLSLLNGATLATPGIENRGSVLVGSGCTFTVAGNYTQTSGSTLLESGGTLQPLLAGSAFIQGGLLGGNGTIGFLVENSAVVSPGASAGTLTGSSDYTQTGSGRLAIELGGSLSSEFDHFDLAGSAALAGTLGVSLINGFTPTLGESFSIMNYGSESGAFDTTDLPALPGILAWETQQNPTEFLLVVAQTDTIPPSLAILTGPAEGSTVIADSATFTWTGSDDATPRDSLEFSYQIDGSGFSSWAPDSSATVTGLGIGGHVFDLRARDLNGNITSIARNFSSDLAVRWISDADGNWQDGANWNTGTAPTSADSVVIDRPSADVTVSVPTSGQTGASLYCSETLQITSGTLGILGASEIANLIINGTGTLGGTGDILVTSGMAWYGGTVAGSGVITLDTGTSNSMIEVGINRTLSGRTLRNLGDLGWSGRTLNLQFGAVLDNQGLIQSYGTGARSIQTTDGFSNASSFVNSGTLQITGSHTLTLGAGINLDLDISGSGLFDLDAGTLRFEEPATIDGAFDVAPAAALEFNASTQTLTASSSIVSLGTVTKTGSGSASTAGSVDVASLSVSGGSFSIAHDDTIPSVTVSGGTFSVAGDLLVTSGLAFNSGTMSGSGTTTLDTGTSNSMIDVGASRTLSGRTLRNLGNLGWSGRALSLQSGAVLDNQGFIQSYGTGARSLNTVSGSASFVNDGTLQITGAQTLTLSAAINLDLNISGSGLFDLDAGTLRFQEPATIDGSFDVASGATLEFFADTQTLTASSSLVSLGTVAKSGSGSASTAGSVDVASLSVTGGSFTIAHDDTIPSVSVNGGTLAVSGDLLVTSDLTWNAGTMSGAGTTTLDTGTTNAFPSGGSRTLTSGRTLRNLGSIGWSAGGLTLDNGATLDNQGLLHSYGTGGRNITTASGGNLFGYVINDGTFQKSGTHVLTFSAGINRTLETSGTGLFDIDEGTFRFQQPATIDGTFDVAPGAVLDFNASNQVLTASSSLVSQGTVARSGLSDTYSVTVSGNLDIASLYVDRGTFSVSHGDTIPSITVNGGALAVGGDLLVTTGMAWYGGTMSGAGTTTLDTGTTNSLPNGSYTRILTSGRTLRNLGNLAWSADNLLLNSNATLDNQGGMSVYGSGTRTLQSSTSNTGTFLNSGTLQKASTNTFNINTSISVTNTGIFDVDDGTLQINGPFSNYAANTLTGGTYQVTSTLRIQNANILTNAADIVLDGPSSQIVDQNLANALANLALNDADGNLTLLNARALVTPSLENRGDVLVGDGCTFTVSGDYTQTAGSTVLETGGALQPAFAGTAYIQGGYLGGDGTIGFAVENDAVVSPGASAGTLTAGAQYLQSAGGRLQIELGGSLSSEFDHLNIASNAALAGTLGVSLINGFSPTLGESFSIMNYGSESGAFDAFDLPPLPGLLNWEPQQNGTEYLLVVAEIDTIPPTVAILTGPAEGSTVAANEVTFTWTGSDETSPRDSLQFSYQIDAGGFSAWAPDSSATLPGLAAGPHVFDLRARDLQGNIGSIARNFNTDVAVRWAVDASGTWSNGANWNTGFAPTAGDSVVIDRAAGSYTITVSSAADARAVTCEEVLVLAPGGILTVPGPVLVNNSFNLTGGRLVGAVVLNGASTLVTYTGGTLDGVTLNTAMEESGTSRTLSVENGLILNDVLEVDGGSQVTFNGSQTLAGTGEILFVSNTYTNRVNSATGDTLTIGPGITIHGFRGIVSDSPTQYVVNQGTILADQPGASGILVNGLVSTSGLLDADGGTLSLITGVWTNAGLLRSRNGGALNLGGTTTTTGLGSFEGVSGTVFFTGLLDNAGDDLALSASTGSPVLSVGGRIQGGSVSSGDATRLRYASGTLDGVTLNTGMEESGTSRTLSVENGLVLNDVLEVDGSAHVTFNGSQAITGTGEILFPSNAYTSNQVKPATGDTLTIGPGISVHGFWGTVSTSPTEYVVNEGTILADQSGGNGISVNGLVSTSGLLDADGGVLSVVSGTWTNTGTLRSRNSGTLNLGGSTTTAGLGTWEGVTGTIQLTGLLDNSGADLALSAAAGSLVLASGGEIQGGSVSSGDGTSLRYSNGLLDGVTLDTKMEEVGNNSVLDVENGLMLNDVLEVDGGAGVSFNGSQAITGTGEVLFPSNGFTNNRMEAVIGDTLTIGPGITVHGYRGKINSSANRYLVNQGTIVGDQPGATGLTVDGLVSTSGLLDADGGVLTVVSGAWINTGTLRSRNGGTLALGGTTTTAGLGTFDGVTGTLEFRGLLDNAGADLVLSTATGPLVLATGGEIQGGSVSSGDGTSLQYSNGLLDGVTLNTKMEEVGNNSVLNVENGLVLNDVLEVDGSALISFNGTQAITGAGEVFFASNGFNSNRLDTSIGDTLTVGSGITVHGHRGYVNTAPTRSLVNQGTIRADEPGGAGIILHGLLDTSGLLESDGGILTVSSGSPDNSGTVQSQSGGTLTVQAPFTTSGAIHVAPASQIFFVDSFEQTAGTTTVDDTSILSSTQDLLLSGGVLQGSGVVNGNVINQAEVSPGASAGELSIGSDYTQNGAGVLRVEMGGATQADYDRLLIGNQASLAGSLAVTLIDGFSPAPGDSFTVLEYVGHTGAFDHLDLPPLSAGMSWNVVAGPTFWSLVASDPDTLPPNTLIVSGPADGGWSDTTGVTITWSGSDNRSPVDSLLYSYQVDADPPSAFLSGTSVTLNLSEGAHSFQVQARDEAGNDDPTPATLSFTVDFTDPETQILAGPVEGSTVDTSAVYVSWIGSDDFSPVDSLQYSRRLDGGAFTPFTADTSTTLGSLTEGAHTLEVKARDLALNEDATPATRSFVVDLTAPVVTLTAGPAEGEHVDTTGVSMGWTASDTISPRDSLEFRYELDAGGFSTWGPDSTADFAGLAEGSHTFEVQARDLVGRIGSAARNFTVDVTPPASVLIQGPSEGGFADSTVTFGWAGTDNISTPAQLEYSFDVDASGFGPFSAATDVTLNGLAAGPHSFSLRARDLAGNVEPVPVLVNFEVDVLDPETVLLSGPAEGSTVDSSFVDFSWTGSDDRSPVDSLRFSYRLDGASYSAFALDTSTSVAVTDGAHTFEVKARDLAGNEDPTPAVRNFVADVTPPAVSFTAAPAPGASLDTTDVDFAWTAVDAVSPRDSLEFAWRIDGGALSPWSPDSTTTLLGLAEGLHTFEAQSRDLVGKIGSASRTFRIDVTPPSIQTPTATLEDAYQVKFTLTALDAGGISGFHVQVAHDISFAAPLADSMITGGSPRTLLYQGAPGNTYYARAFAADLAGNQSPYSGPSNGIVIADLPDLIATSVMGPPTASSGQDLQVMWTVQNVGPGGTNVPKWFDKVYLSPSPVFNSGTATFLGSVENLTYLAPGETYTNEATFTLPDGIAGSFYAFVEADGSQDLNEPDATNNFGGSGEIVISLSDYPDLQTDLVTVPSSDFSGNSININWTVKNHGVGRTDVDNWNDTVFLSPDSTFDFTLPAPGQIKFLEQPLGTFHHVGALEADSSYSASGSVVLPPQISGKYWIFVWSDISVTFYNQQLSQTGSVFENVSELNNAASDTIQVTLTPPADLVVETFTGPSTAASGTSIALDWTVKNTGFNPTFESFWKDRVYMSTDAVFDAGDAAVATVGHSGVLDRDSTYAVTQNISLSPSLEGTRWFFVKTDYDNAAVEYDDGNNLAGPIQVDVTLSPWPDLQVTNLTVPATGTAGSSVAISWRTQNLTMQPLPSNSWGEWVYLSASSVFNQGSATRVLTRTVNASTAELRSATLNLSTSLSGTYYIHVLTDASNQVFEGTDEGNNVSPAGTIVIDPHPPVNLAISNLVVPPSLSTGESFSMSWTVDNLGTGGTLVSSWPEQVYLSTDNVLSPATDILLSSTSHSGSLAGGAGYNRQLQRTISNGFTAGDYYFIVRTDPNAATGDIDTANNVIVSGAPITISTTPPPDLELSSLATDPSAVAGQPLRVRWTITNIGTGVPVPADWKVGLYLSSDPLLDGSDLALNTLPGGGSLAPAAAYQDSFDVEIPAYASGAYYVVAKADAQNKVYEAGSEANNTLAAPVVVSLSAPADLIVTSVTAPAAAVPGDPVTVDWTIQNIGTNGINDLFVREAIYVSLDSTFDSQMDPLVGLLEHNITIPPGGSLASRKLITLSRTYAADLMGNITDVLPGVVPGDYHFLVRTNVTNNVRETDYTNNMNSTGTVTQVDVAELVLEVPQTGAMTQGQERYYRIAATAGLDMTVKVSSDETDATNEIYVAYNRVPDLDDFDFTGPPEFTSAPSVLIPSTQAGDYYVLVRARALPFGASTQNVTTRADAIPFSISSITPGAGGTQGQVTTVLRGAGFRDFTQVSLDFNGILIPAAGVEFINTTELRVRWDLNGVPTEIYDVRATNPGETVVLTDGFTVELPLDLMVETTSVHPDVIRDNSTAYFTFKYKNTANWNVPQFHARLVFPASASLISLSTSDRLFANSDLFPGAGPVVDDHYAADDPSTGSQIKVVDLLAADIAPGEELLVTLGLRNFPGSPFSVKTLTEVMDTGTFVARESARIEQIRQYILGNASGYVSAVLDLAADAQAFEDSAFANTYVANGILTAEELSLLQSMSAVGLRLETLSGRPDYLDMVQFRPAADSTECVILEPTPECIPDPNPVTCALPDCAVCFQTSAPARLLLPLEINAQIDLNLCDNLSESLCADAKVVTACDPNQITGPAGYGDEKWVAASQTFQYTVDFENLAETASAPAQIVNVRVPLDDDLNLSSFRLGNIGFGINVVSVPPNTSSFTDEQYYSNIGLRVRIVAGVDISNREAFWTFTSIDPNTGDVPTDPYIGFLPVNNVFGDGQGYCLYSISPSASSPTGNVVDARATIVFDTNAPLLTNTASNTLDNGVPTSNVVSSTPVNETTHVLQWTGTDPEGAGLQAFNLYMKQDDGPYLLLQGGLTGTSYQFNGASGHIYGFHTRATDLSGNMEPAKTVSEVEIPIGMQTSVPGRDLPHRFALMQNAPNPFTGTTRIAFSLPRDENVDLYLFDVAGRLVEKVLDGKRLPAGDHLAEIDGSRYSSGVYFYRLHAGGKTFSRKMLLVR